MTIEHLQYCLSEIQAAYESIQVPNIDFYKRSMARMIAVRTKDFINIARQLNNHSLRRRSIRGDLNTFESLYQEFLERQRNKYGAHFQDMDLLTHLQTWQDIDVDRINFFSQMAKDLYALFFGLPDFAPVAAGLVTSADQQAILDVNAQYNIEQYPNLSSDILSFTRANSGGLVHGTGLQQKLGSLKAIELLLDYEVALIKACNSGSAAHQLFNKLFIVDLVSYADNLYTRTDIVASAPQYELGLNGLVDIQQTPDAVHILTDFQTGYRFDELLADLRDIRNTSCGHIDSNIPVAQLILQTIEFDFEKYHRFYQQLQQLLIKVLHSDIIFSPFLLTAGHRLHGVIRMNGTEQRPFDPSVVPEAYVRPSLERPAFDETEITQQWTKYLLDPTEELQHYFYLGFNEAPVVNRVQVEISSGDGGKAYRYYDYRTLHQFFEQQLTATTVDLTAKQAIINLFVDCRRGNPVTTAATLLKTFPSERDLQSVYLQGLSYLLGEPNIAFFDYTTSFLSTGNGDDRFIALTALFRHDLRTRLVSNGHHRAEPSKISDYILHALSSEPNPFIGAAAAIAMAGELAYRDHHVRKAVIPLYYRLLQDVFLNAVKNLAGPRTTVAWTAQLDTAFRQGLFADVLYTTGIFFHEHGALAMAQDFWRLLTSNEVTCFQTDEELNHLAAALKGIGDLDWAIDIARGIMSRNPHKHQPYQLLLQLYLGDQKHKAVFERDRQYVVDHFRLSAEEKQAYEAMQY